MSVSPHPRFRGAIIDAPLVEMKKRENVRIMDAAFPCLLILLVCWFYALALPSATFADGLSATAIMARMKSVYAKADSYQDQGMVEVVIRFPKRIHKVQKPFTTAFIRPDRFRFAFREKEHFAKTSRFVAFKDGKEVRAHWDLDKNISKIDSLGEALAAAAGISGGSARTVPTMLMPEESRFANAILLFSSPRRSADEVLDGRDCYRIEDPNTYRNLTLWIDKKEYLLRKIYVEKDLEDSRAETTTTYVPILNGVVREQLLDYDSKFHSQ
jgi:hypothetical protein